MELFLDLLWSGEVDFRHKKQVWDRVCTGREQLRWENYLREILAEQPRRLEVLLRKGRLSGGALDFWE